MKKITLCFFALMNLCILISSAQTFQNIIGTPENDERGYSVAASVDGNMLFGGTLTKFGKEYPFLLSLNADGTVDKAVTVESLGAVLSSFVDITAVHTATGKPNGYIAVINYDYDIIAVRLNNYARILWSKVLYSTTDIPIKIEPTYSPITNYLSGFYLLADQYGYRHSLLKLSAGGDIVWQKLIANPADAYGYYPKSILPTNDGGCLIVGMRKESGNWNSSIVKFAHGGALVWSRSYDFFGGNNSATAITSTNDGYVVLGSDSSYLVFKIDTSGNILWSNRYSTPYYTTNVRAIIADIGNIIFGGPFNNFSDTAQPAWIIKLNSSGNVLFGKSYYYHSDINDIALNADGYSAIGTTERPFFSEPDNVYFLKTDFTGNIGGDCSSMSMSVVKEPHRFINITEPNFKIKTDTFKMINITLNTRNLSDFEQSWCGSNFTNLNKTSNQSLLLSHKNFNAYANISAKEIYVLYSTKNNLINDKYDLILYNGSGMQISKQELQPNVPVKFSMSQQPPGVYIVVLLKEGRIVERQNVIWVR